MSVHEGHPAESGLAALLDELKANGLPRPTEGFDVEQHGGADWKVFYAAAPDGLCYWFGEAAGL